MSFLDSNLCGHATHNHTASYWASSLSHSTADATPAAKGQRRPVDASNNHYRMRLWIRLIDCTAARRYRTHRVCALLLRRDLTRSPCCIQNPRQAGAHHLRRDKRLACGRGCCICQRMGGIVTIKPRSCACEQCWESDPGNSRLVSAFRVRDGYFGLFMIPYYCGQHRILFLELLLACPLFCSYVLIFTFWD